MTIIYLDACCWSRITDDLSIERNRKEAASIVAILLHSEAGHCSCLSSEVVRTELEQTSDGENREIVLRNLERFGYDTIVLDPEIERMAANFSRTGSIASLDALHLASAISGGVQIFLTTDDKLVKKAARLRLPSGFRILNPIAFRDELWPST